MPSRATDGYQWVLESVLLSIPLRAWHCALQKPKESGGKPVSDQWIPPFVIVDDDDKPVGPIEASPPTHAPSSSTATLAA